MSYTRVVARPDPRVRESWCGEGVAHDHQACGLGSMWDSSDPRDVAEARRWTDSQPAAARPTRASLMTLVRQYALARITANATVPSRNASTTVVGLHRRDVAEVQRLEREIATALAAAGID